MNPYFPCCYFRCLYLQIQQKPEYLFLILLQVLLCLQICVIRGRVPGDTSSAAYWIVGATLLEGSRLLLPGVGMNPTRAAIVDLLVDWGADVVIERGDDWCGERVANLRIRGAGTALPRSGVGVTR